MRIHTGDLVEYKPLQNPGEKKELRRGIVLGNGKNRGYCIRGHISIDGQILPTKNVIRIIKHREKLRDWWNYVDSRFETKKVNQ